MKLDVLCYIIFWIRLPHHHYLLNWNNFGLFCIKFDHLCYQNTLTKVGNVFQQPPFWQDKFSYGSLSKYECMRLMYKNYFFFMAVVGLFQWYFQVHFENKNYSTFGIMIKFWQCPVWNCFTLTILLDKLLNSFVQYLNVHI